MASNYIEMNDEQHHNQHEHHHYHHLQSPRSFKRTLSNNSSSSGGGEAAPKCVCAPATHANSFKCRLHRAASQGHVAPPPPEMRPPHPGPASAASRTVEAQ